MLLRNTTVPKILSIWLIGAILAIAAGYGIVARVSEFERRADPPGATVASLRSELPGARVEVPRRAGIWITQYDNAVLMLVGGVQSSMTQHIDLCQQRSRSREDHERIIPIRIGEGWKDVEARVAGNLARDQPVHMGIRNAMIMSRSPVDPAPWLEIVGRASRLGGANGTAGLTVNVRAGIQSVAAVSDAAGGKAVQIDARSVGSLAFIRQAWIIWSDLDSKEPVRSTSGASIRADHAIQISRRHSATCDAGSLDVRLLQAGPDPVLQRAESVVFSNSGGISRSTLLPGTYDIPASPAPALEDRALFNSALAQRMIRLNRDRSIELIPRDFRSWSISSPANRLDEPWNQIALDRGAESLLRRMHHSADGAFVINQIKQFNNARWLSAIRFRSTSPALSHIMNTPRVWEVSVGGRAGPSSVTMPRNAIRLFNELPEGWSSWVRAGHWPSTVSSRTSVIYRTRLENPAKGGERAEILVVGRVVSIRGATRAGAIRPACMGPACSREDLLQHAMIEIDAGARALEIETRPEDALELGNEAEFRHVRVRNGQVLWEPLSPRHEKKHPLAEVFIADRSGSPLWQRGELSTTARDAGLEALLGISPDHENSLAGNLARLGPAGWPRAQARVTLDSALQRVAHDVLGCVGYRQGMWNGTQCEDVKSPPVARRAGLVILDAGSGEILAAAGTPAVPKTVPWEDIRDFDSMNPGQSPLRITAWQHDGDPTRAAGSVFKLLTSLGLEQAALENKGLDSLLAGKSILEINRGARSRGEPFDMFSPCYPERCDDKQPRIRNYNKQLPVQKAREGRFGLSDALTHSVNTWFAWMHEQTDRTLLGLPKGGVPDVFALDDRALDTLRPALLIAHKLGFERSVHLDGGLLPANFPWQSRDVLQTTPSAFDPIQSRHQVRQFAIGLRMQVTPLQMAVVSASIAEGRVVSPYLLMKLNGESAKPDAVRPIGIRLERIKAGMKDVIDRGTAATAFGGASMAHIRMGLYGKTGTAPIAASGQGGHRTDLNAVWFTGWLEPGTVPGENRRLAFACFISHSKDTGGSHAAAVVASLLRVLVRDPQS